MLAAGIAAAADTIKVGVLHSLSGTMAISETTLKDTVLMMIDEQNKKGGLLGKKLEAVVVDPASNWPLFAEKAAELLEKDKVAVVFGCWTSVSRKSVLPVFEKDNGLLFYPVQYEGEESEQERHLHRRGANQQAIPAVEYLMKEVGVKRWVLEGTDYVYPRTTNKILEAFLLQKGVKPEDIMINYTPFGFSDWTSEVSKIKAFGSAGKKTAVVSTINGDANVPFYKELGNQKVSAEDIPVVAFSVGEEELSGLDAKPLVGHLAAWNYFMSIDNAGQQAVDRYLARLHQEPQAHLQRSDGGARHWLPTLGQGGTEGQQHRPRKGHRGTAGTGGAEPHRRHRQGAAEPPHHQAGVHRRDSSRRAIRRRLEDAGHGARRGLVALPAGRQGHRRRLGHAQVRQLQHLHQGVLGPELQVRAGKPLSAIDGRESVRPRLRWQSGPQTLMAQRLLGCCHEALVAVCAAGTLAAIAGDAWRSRARRMRPRRPLRPRICRP